MNGTIHTTIQTQNEGKTTQLEKIKIKIMFQIRTKSLCKVA